MLGTPGTATPYEAFFYRKDKLEAVRSGNWKLHLRARKLYDLAVDIAEKTNLYSENPDVVQKLKLLANEFCDDLEKNSRPAGYVANPIPLTTRD